MNKVALKKIGFAEQNEINDVWVEQQVQVRSTTYTSDGATWRWFDNIDQSNALLEESITDNDNGIYYTTDVSFTVRTEADMALAKKYEKRPLVVKVEAVDGNIYKIGTKQYPVRMTTKNIYDGLTVREIQVSLSFDSLTGVLS